MQMYNTEEMMHITEPAAQKHR